MPRRDLACSSHRAFLPQLSRRCFRLSRLRKRRRHRSADRTSRHSRSSSIVSPSRECSSTSLRQRRSGRVIETHQDSAWPHLWLRPESTSRSLERFSLDSTLGKSEPLPGHHERQPEQRIVAAMSTRTSPLPASIGFVMSRDRGQQTRTQRDRQTDFRYRRKRSGLHRRC